MKKQPTLLCLTGFLGSGKTTVKDMFAEYKDVKTCLSLDELRTLKTDKKIVVYDSLKSLEEKTVAKWLSGIYDIMVVNVNCPTDIRIQRVKERDGCSDMVFHLRDKERKAELYDVSCLSKYNIYNGRSLEDTSGQVYYIHTLLTRDDNNLILKNNLTNQR